MNDQDRFDIVELAHLVVIDEVQNHTTATLPDADAMFELDGVSWCVAHNDVWYEGDTDCVDVRRNQSGGECSEAPLFIPADRALEGDL